MWAASPCYRGKPKQPVCKPPDPGGRKEKLPACPSGTPVWDTSGEAAKMNRFIQFHALPWWPERTRHSRYFLSSSRSVRAGPGRQFVTVGPQFSLQQGIGGGGTVPVIGLVTVVMSTGRKRIGKSLLLGKSLMFGGYAFASIFPAICEGTVTGPKIAKNALPGFQPVNNDLPNERASHERNIFTCTVHQVERL